MQRPFHALTVSGMTAHQVFELLGGTGIFFQRQLGLRTASALWGLLCAAWIQAVRRDRPGILSVLAGSSAAVVALHYNLWQWSFRGPLPLLTEAEGFPAHTRAAVAGYVERPSAFRAASRARSKRAATGPSSNSPGGVLGDRG